MAIKMVLFDLDGTLLPMDMDEFTMGYFKMLAAKAARPTATRGNPWSRESGTA